MDRRRPFALALALSALAACGGGGGGSGGAPPPPGSVLGNNDLARCLDSFRGESSAYRITECFGTACGDLDDPAPAIDGNAATYSNILFENGSSGTEGVGATAQAGVVFPAGNPAGALMSFPESNSVQESLSIRTLLDGVLQETSLVFAEGPEGPPRNSDTLYTFETTQPFDTVEVRVTVTGAERTSLDAIHLVEVCAQ